MSTRDDIVEAFIAQSAWATWQRTPLAGDASGRRYERLRQGAASVVLMDAPKTQGEDTKTFAQIADVLARRGLSAPQILAHDSDKGLMILSDLGADDFAKWLVRKPQDERQLYKAATDVLVHLNGFSPDLPLIRMTPQVGGDMVAITPEFYGGGSAPDLSAAITAALAQFAPEPATLALRDYHAENLIWRPGVAGMAQVGLLDFQDAFIAPAGYDLASLLGDVRRDVDPAVAVEMRDYFMKETGATAMFPAQLACLGAQRNLRILGVFARLAKVSGKPKYLELLPRVWRNMMRDIDHPALSDLRAVVTGILPPPDEDILLRLRR